EPEIAGGRMGQVGSAAKARIKNRDKLLSTGDTEGRKILLEIVTEVLERLDSRRVIGDLLRWDGRHLSIGEFRWDLQRKRRVFVVGAGKAANAMARAVEEKLGDRIDEGIVIVKTIEPGDRLESTELVEGGHPLPNERGLEASKRILRLVDEAGPDDLFLGLISGGSSALMNCPVPGISLDDEIKATEMLLKSGARILEINAVRRHISATNGGRLAQRIEARGAEMINLILSDSVGARPTTDPANPAAFFGTPVAPDGTTLENAREVLKKYGLTDRIPRAIRDYIETGDPARETPKTLGPGIHHFVCERPADACEAAYVAAARIGLPAVILTTVLEGESAQAGGFLASVAREVRLNGRPASAPCVLIAGGETTTRVDGQGSEGGPSQELALGFALEVADRPGFCIAAIDMDGTDGPTALAGGMADDRTVSRARVLGFNVYESLAGHESSVVLRALGDEIVTGNTGTNLCDLNLIYVGPERTSG
ncbi:MAG: glycerate kinase type-2 family protein, partial [Syntrophales bacterium]